MRRATQRDAINTQQFYFRQQVVPSTDDQQGGPTEQEYAPMTLDAIVNGKDGFHGLVPLVRSYVDSVDMDVNTRCTVLQYLSLISRKASGGCGVSVHCLTHPWCNCHVTFVPTPTGELLTTASWMRKFICSHPDYKKDSVVSEAVTYDLIRMCKDISEGNTPCLELTGTLMSKTPPEYQVPVCSENSSAHN